LCILGCVNMPVPMTWGHIFDNLRTQKKANRRELHWDRIVSILNKCEKPYGCNKHAKPGDHGETS
jgi:hypothetical protein